MMSAMTNSPPVIKVIVVVLLPVGFTMVYLQRVLGVVVLAAAAFLVPIVIRQTHDERATPRRGRREG